ncbi:MAG TPA: redoxin domain-containing protein [Oceanipulchritudo sp.]|nr:redoxin domain-containing protein [Oceanipulchritudo sp.]
MAISVNSKAPVLTLKRKTNEGLKDVSLSEYIGKKKTVILFFPFAFSSICKDELCSISGGMDQYSALDAQVIGISVDLPFALEAFANINGINFPLLSDFNKEAATAYDVLYTDIAGLKGVAKRSAFVVGEDGTILFSSSSDDPKQLPPFDEIKAVLQ